MLLMMVEDSDLEGGEEGEPKEFDVESFDRMQVTVDGRINTCTIIRTCSVGNDLTECR